MKLNFAGALGGWEMILIFAVILLLFGARKLPELARGLGHAIREFRKASREVADEITNVPNDTDESTPSRKEPDAHTQNSNSATVAQSGNNKS